MTIKMNLRVTSIGVSLKDAIEKHAIEATDELSVSEPTTIYPTLLTDGGISITSIDPQVLKDFELGTYIEMEIRSLKAKQA
jgi:hypothetical protein